MIHCKVSKDFFSFSQRKKKKVLKEESKKKTNIHPFTYLTPNIKKIILNIVQDSLVKEKRKRRRKKKYESLDAGFFIILSIKRRKSFSFPKYIYIFSPSSLFISFFFFLPVNREALMATLGSRTRCPIKWREFLFLFVSLETGRNILDFKLFMDFLNPSFL